MEDNGTSSIFSGLNFHIQTTGVDHTKQWTIRGQLEAGGAQYVSNPEDPRCNVIFVFSRLAERTLYRPKGEAQLIETCRQESWWTFDDFCTHFGRREGDKKAKVVVVKATWVEHCLQIGRQCREGRWALHEVMVRDVEPLKIVVGSSNAMLFKTEQPLTPMSLCTPSPRLSIGPSPYQLLPQINPNLQPDLFTPITVVPSIVERPKLLDPFTKDRFAPRTFHVLACINQSSHEDSIILRGGLIDKNVDMADFILVDQSDPETPVLSLKLVHKQQALSIQWLRDSVASGEIQELEPYKIDLSATTATIEKTDEVSQSAASTESVHRRIVAHEPDRVSDEPNVKSGIPSQAQSSGPDMGASPPELEGGKIDIIPVTSSHKQAAAADNDQSADSAELDLDQSPMSPKAWDRVHRRKRSTHLGKSIRGVPTALDSRQSLKAHTAITIQDQERYKLQIIAALDDWFKNGSPGSRTAVLDELNRKHQGHSRAGVFLRHRESISQALSELGHDVGVGGKLNGNFFDDESKRFLATGVSPIPSYYLPSLTTPSSDQPVSHKQQEVSTSNGLDRVEIQSASADLPPDSPQVDPDMDDGGSRHETDMDIDMLSDGDDSSLDMDENPDENDEDPSLRPPRGQDRRVVTPENELRVMDGGRSKRLLARIIQELDVWCKMECPDNRTRFLNTLSRTKPGFNRVSFFKRHRMEILGALRKLGHDVSEGTKIYGLGRQGRGAEQRLAMLSATRKGGESVNAGSQNRASPTQSAIIVNSNPDIGDSDFDEGQGKVKIQSGRKTTKVLTYDSDRSGFSGNKRTARLISQIVDDLEGWCNRDCPGSRSEFLDGLTRHDPGHHRRGYFVHHRMEILQALAERGHDVSEGTKIYGVNVRSVRAHARRLALQAGDSQHSGVSVPGPSTACPSASGTDEPTPGPSSSKVPSDPATSASMTLVDISPPLPVGEPEPCPLRIPRKVNNDIPAAWFNL